jgi:molybdopterin molybdotransferase
MNAPISPAPPPARAPLRSLDEVLADLLGRASTLGGIQQVSTFDADGRVLAQDLVSGLQVPPHDNSAMDGYAVRTADLAAGKPLPVSQRIAAGAQGVALAPATVARIFTGAPVPPGADAVVMQEEAEVVSDGVVQFRGPPAAGQHIRRSGEDVTRGAVVLPQGPAAGRSRAGHGRQHRPRAGARGAPPARGAFFNG